MSYTATKTDVKKDIRYLNKDFSSFRSSLIEFAKTYFPNNYNDFNEASPGMMFIEMAAYVGDVLSYYIDNQFKESLLAYAEERKTLFALAQTFGYKPRLSSPSSGDLDFFQLVPAIGGEGDVQPDMRFALTIKENSLVSSTTTGTIFRTMEDVNFKFSSSLSPMTIDIFEKDDSTNLPTKYLLKKTGKIESGNITEEQFTFTDAQKFDRIKLANKGVIEIISVTDNDGNNWSKVDSLAQETVFEDVENSMDADGNLGQFKDDAPYLLKVVKTPRRYTTYYRSDNFTELRFGAGVSDNPDEEIIPNPDNVGSSLPGGVSNLETSFDPSNFLKTRAYGLAPSNTTLTVKYSFGGGIQDNSPQDSITQINSITFAIQDSNLDSTQVQTAKESVGVNNPNPTKGGLGSETVEEIRENTKAFFQAQNRAVTKQDYIGRVYALPPRYGNVAKAYIVQDDQLNESPQARESDAFITEEDIGKTVQAISERIPNPLALNLYVLGYNQNNNLVPVNRAVKENIKTYLSSFRSLTDAVNIKTPYVINIGVKFSVVTKVGFNKNDVVLRCVEEVKRFFDIDRWQINQPIVLTDLAYKLSLIDGVGSIVPPQDNNPNNLPILIENKFQKSGGYSGNLYDINDATIDGIIYPSLDPSIFEVKFPNVDIEGRAVGNNIGTTTY